MSLTAVTLCPECDQETLLITDTLPGGLLLVRCESCHYIEVAEAMPDDEAA